MPATAAPGATVVRAAVLGAVAGPMVSGPAMALARLAAMLLAAMTGPAAAQDPPGPSALAVPAGVLRPTLLGCALGEAATGPVAAVPDGRSFRLADGTEVLLAGIEVAPVDVPAEAAAEQPGPGAAARAALESLVRGRAVAVLRATPLPDRWGRLVGWGFLDGGTRSLQRELLAQGLARVAGRVDDQACLPALRAAEREARQAELGLWSDPVYAALAAEQPAEILRRRGRFAVIVGRVDSVRESGGTIYMNFGRRWSEAFAATIPKRIERTLTAAGVDPRRLAGRRVEVRGVVEQRGGPRIEVLRAEQLAIERR